MSAVNRGLRQASKQVRLSQRVSNLSCTRSSAGLQSAFRLQNSSSTSTSALPNTRTSSFSTMASLQSAAPGVTPMPAHHKGYDPEITDIADYVLNKNIDSDLAVSLLSPLPPLPAIRLKKPQSQKSHEMKLAIHRTKYPKMHNTNMLTTNVYSSTLPDGSSLTLSAAVLRASASRSAPSSLVLPSQAPLSPTAPRSPVPPTSSTPSMPPSTLAP